MYQMQPGDQRIMKVAIYFRTSTGKQDLTLQKLECLKYCKNAGYTIFNTYEDEGYSGRSLNRPAFKKMLSDAFKKEFNTILIYSFSRLSRNIRDLLNTLHGLEERKIQVISIKEQIDTTTASGRLFLNVTGSMYEFQKDVQNEMIREKLRILKEQGKPLGRPKVKVSLEVATTLRRKGLSIREIAKRMGVGRNKIYTVLKTNNVNKGFSL